MDATSIDTLHTWKAEFCADSVEWCPVKPFQSIFVCGTYQLQEKESESEHDSNEEKGSSQSRIGCLYTFKCTKEELTLMQRIEMPGILDLKWCHSYVNGKALLGIVNSQGTLMIYYLSENTDELKLEFLSETKISDDDRLCLSLDWSTGKYPSEEPCVVVSDSKGMVTLSRITNQGIVMVCQWQAHGYEAWITAFNYWNISTVYSGGDDCKLRVFDIRENTSTPLFTSRAHDAGVTSFHSNASRENLLSSGSYDEKLLLWDSRNMKGSLNSTSLTGGIWRLKWDPLSFTHLLAACMHGGYCLVNCDKIESSAEQPIIAVYKEHDSLGYGADWCYDVELSGDSHVVATCSFYDCKMCVWKCTRNL